jgi:hypothetical protein
MTEGITVIVIIRRLPCFQQSEEETGRFMQPARRPVFANAVKQSTVRAWIASPCGFAMTGRSYSDRHGKGLRGSRQNHPAYAHGLLHCVRNDGGDNLNDIQLRGSVSDGRKKEALCRHQEKYAAFQQSGMGKWRFIQPAHCLVEEITLLSAERTGNRMIHTACPPPRHCERSEAIHCTRMDCFTAFAMTENVSETVFRLAMSGGDGRSSA